MLMVTVLAGLAAVSTFFDTGAAVFYTVAVVLSHLARPALVELVTARSIPTRRGAAAWLLAYALAGVAAAAVLLLVYHRWWLLVVAAGGAGAAAMDVARSVRRQPQSIPVQAAGAAAMALFAPGAYYAASARLDNAALALAIGMAAHLVSRVWVVTAHVHWRRAPVLDLATRWRYAWPGPAIVLAGLAAALAVDAAGGGPARWVWAVGLDLIMATASVMHGPRDTPFRALGVQQTITSVLFSTILVVTLRIP